MRNYIRLNGIFGLRVNFAYVDVEDYLADQMFIKEKVQVKFKSHYMKKDEKYMVILASCWAKDFDKVERALSKLSEKMVIFGYNDYEEFTNDLLTRISDERKARLDKRRK